MRRFPGVGQRVNKYVYSANLRYSSNQEIFDVSLFMGNKKWEKFVNLPTSETERQKSHETTFENNFEKAMANLLENWREEGGKNNRKLTKK